MSRCSGLKTQWEPRAVTAYLRGFYMRVSMDPRIAKTALLAFRRALHAVFRGADAAIANEVLR